jgi:hypothetical protein
MIINDREEDDSQSAREGVGCAEKGEGEEERESERAEGEQGGMGMMHHQPTKSGAPAS